MVRFQPTSVAGFPRCGSRAAYHTFHLPFPSSNRTCGFPASGSPEQSRHRHLQGSLSPRHATACLAFQPSCCLRMETFPSGSLRHPISGAWGTFRSSVVVPTLRHKRLSFRLPSACCSIEPLGSADVTPLLRYYGLLRLPSHAAALVMVSQAGLPLQWRTVGPPRFLGSLSGRAALNHPGGVLRVPMPVASSQIIGFNKSGCLAIPHTRVTRPNQVRLRCGSHLRLMRLRRSGHPWLRSRDSMVNRQ